MDKTFYFVSGLPRSGSTALTALLNQNPRFNCSSASPVIKYIRSMTEIIDMDPIFYAAPRTEQARKLIHDILPTWHSGIDKPVIFDKNRLWSQYYENIQEIWGIDKPKIICCVRDIAEILASILRVIHKTPIDNGYLNFVDFDITLRQIGPLTDETRCSWLLQPESFVGEAIESLMKACEANYPIHIVEYNDLCNKPDEVMQGIYEYLGEEWFEHDYDNLDQSAILDDDKVIHLPGMHTIRKKLGRTSGSPNDVLPAVFQESLKGAEFWRKSDITN